MGFNPFSSGGGGGGANQNLDNAYENIGFGTGGGTSCPAHASANTKGVYTQLTAGGGGGVTQNDLRGLFLMPLLTSNAGSRWQMDLSIDGGTSVKVPDLYLQPGTSVYGGTPGIYLPLAIAAGADISVRLQSGTASTPTMMVAALGVIANAQSPPCWSICEAINAADNANTRANATNVPLTDAWTELDADTGANAYGAILAVAGSNGTVLGTAQTIGVQLGLGAASSEVAFGRWLTTGATSEPAMPRGFSPLFSKNIPANSRISAKAFGAVAGTDNIRVQLLGFR